MNARMKTPHANPDGTYGMFGLDGDWRRRAELLSGSLVWRDTGDIAWFSGMPPAALRELIDGNFAMQGTMADNPSPSAREFLEYMESHEGVTAVGLAVSPERPDYRVQIEGMVLARPYTPGQEESFRAFCCSSWWSPPDELFETDADLGRGLRARWD